MQTTTFSIRTGERFSVVDLTERVATWVGDKGDGLCHLLAQHATAGLGLMETGSGSEQDTETVLRRMLPVLVSPSLTVPVIGGALALGTWQSIVLIDPNADNPHRTVRASFVPA